MLTASAIWVFCYMTAQNGMACVPVVDCDDCKAVCWSRMQTFIPTKDKPYAVGCERRIRDLDVFRMGA